MIRITKLQYFLVLFVAFVLGVFAGFAFATALFKATVVGATTQINDGWHDTSECVAPTCGTSEGTKTQERTFYEYAEPTCPTFYHYLNSGNWNERCHRNNGVSHTYPEHKAPTCPEGFGAVDNTCRKTTTEDRTVACEARIVECEQEPTPTPIPPKLCEDTTALNFQGAGECRYPGASSAPQGPACVAPIYAPTLTFNGKEFHWTTVKDGLHIYWMDYGPTKDKLTYSVIVNGESFLPKVGWTGQIWARVRGNDQGCLGPASIILDP